ARCACYAITGDYVGFPVRHQRLATPITKRPGSSPVASSIRCGCDQFLGGATGAAPALGASAGFAAGAALAGAGALAAAFGSGIGLSDKVCRKSITSARCCSRDRPANVMAVPGI